MSQPFQVEVIALEIPLDQGWLRSALLVLHQDGLEGLGEAPEVTARGRDSLESIQAELKSASPKSPAARAAWISALLDLRGRRLGQSVAEVLGGARRRQVTCSHLVRAHSPRAVAREVERWHRAGYRTFKLKALDEGGPLDVERLGAAREAAGAPARLRLDMNGARVRLPAAVRAFNLEYVEQPLDPTAPFADWLHWGPGAAADESLADFGLARALGASGVPLAIKLATVGGARIALRLASAAAGRVTIGSSLETSVGLACALHTACALPSEPLDCGLATASLLEADPGRGLSFDGPNLKLPDGPGLGVSLDREVARRYFVRT